MLGLVGNIEEQRKEVKDPSHPLAVAITKYYTLGKLPRIEIYLAHSFGVWDVQHLAMAFLLHCNMVEGKLASSNLSYEVTNVIKEASPHDLI